MKQDIQKWGRLDKRKQQVNPYGLGSWLKENAGVIGTVVGGVGGALVGMPGLGASIGGSVGGAVQNSGTDNSQLIQQRAALQNQLNNTPQSGGGLPGQLARGGYLTPQLLAKSGMKIKDKSYASAKTPLYTNTPSNYLAKGGIVPVEPVEGAGLNTVTPGFKPSDKTQWNSQSGALSMYKGLVAQGKTKEAEDIIFGYYADEPYGPYKEGTHKEYETKGRIKSMRAKDLVGLDTKQYQAPKDYNALMETLKPKIIDRNPGQQFQNITIKAKGGFMNPLSNNTMDLTRYSSGGTHSQNPLGGIPLGKSLQGKTNSVEQGETSFVFKENNSLSSLASSALGTGVKQAGKYVFSNRLKVKR